MALPDYPRYRKLLEGTRWSFAKLGFGLFLVAENGSVTTGVEVSPCRMNHRSQRAFVAT
jgi:hypothetical protein